jgi:hypothetical protein
MISAGFCWVETEEDRSQGGSFRKSEERGRGVVNWSN